MKNLFNYLKSLPTPLFVGGYIISVLVVGKGVYDIATLNSTATGSETALVWGKTLGATGGAVIGTRVVPGVGTAFFAVLGYVVCGEIIEGTDYFDDDLDKSRKALKESTQALEDTKAKQEEEYAKAKQEYIDFIEVQFFELSNNSTTLSEDNLEKFKTLMVVVNGFVKEDVWDNAIAGGASDYEMLDLSKRGAVEKIDAIKKAREDWVRQQLQEKGY